MDIVRQIKEAKSDQEKIDLFMKYDQDIKTEDYFSFSTEELILAVKAGHYLCRFSKRLHTPEMCEIAVSLVFPDFDSFYNYLNGDLSGAELKNFNFDHVDPGAYSFKGAILKSADEARMTTPDFSLYSHVREGIVAGTFSQSKKNETIKAESVPHELSVQYNIENYRRLFYISDIHITHKIAKKAQKSSSTIKIKEYIETKVDQMVRSASFRNYNDYLMIAGDVSFDFRVSELFYRALAKRWTPRRIIAL